VLPHQKHGSSGTPSTYGKRKKPKETQNLKSSIVRVSATIQTPREPTTASPGAKNYHFSTNINNVSLRAKINFTVRTTAPKLQRFQNLSMRKTS
jgi:hypothetical protein